MHTLIRRTAPHLALARNSLSSGVTTSARNMAAQSRLPPARGGREEPVPNMRSSQGKSSANKAAVDVLGASDGRDRTAECDGGVALNQLGQYHVHRARQPDHLSQI